MSGLGAAGELERTIERYNDAWNAQNLDAIVSFTRPGCPPDSDGWDPLAPGVAPPPRAGGCGLAPFSQR